MHDILLLIASHSDSSDYLEITETNNPLLSFTSDPKTHRQCFNITINDDAVSEYTENFFLSLTLDANYSVPVIIHPPISQVDIKDDDRKLLLVVNIIIVDHYDLDFVQLFLLDLRRHSFLSMKMLA